jgi:hypothetical protein
MCSATSTPTVLRADVVGAPRLQACSSTATAPPALVGMLFSVRYAADRS